MSRCLIVCIVLAVPLMVNAYAKGAPEGACGDMTPQHHVPPQKGKIPYTFEISKKSIKAGDTVNLTIKGKSAENVIKGLLVQARVGNAVVGQFDVGSSPHLQVINCDTGRGNAVTHKKFTGAAPQSISFKWTAPKGLSERVIFYHTVAQNGGIFWVAQKSDIVNVSN